MLTLKQKIASYQYCLHELDIFYDDYYGPNATNSSAPYVCDMLNDFYHSLTGLRFNKPDYVFPEFLKCKPKLLKDPGWWDDDTEGILCRIVALQWCIDSLTNKQK